MNRNNSTLLKILLSLFLLNSLSLYFYFTSHSDASSTPDSHPHSTENHSFLEQNHQNPNFSKPWPILPSYLPWSQNSNAVAARSCEAFFGNGFTRRVDLLPPASSGRGSWFRCFYSETLQSSICEVGMLRMVPGKIRMSPGGETVEAVMGRTEGEELPQFENGAFEVVGERLSLGFKRIRDANRRLVRDDVLNRYVPQGGIDKHAMRELIASIRVVDSKDFVCEEVLFSRLISWFDF